VVVVESLVESGVDVHVMSAEADGKRQLLFTRDCSRWVYYGE
jgi:hypothetical protein